jgi:hypothetical protein
MYSLVTASTIVGSSHDLGTSQYDRSCDMQPESGSTLEVGRYLHYKHV